MDPEVLKQKLRKIDTSSKAIESTSRWCKFYKSDYKVIVETWFSEFLAANVQRKLALVYLCNDLIHKTRADGTQFTEQFYNKLGRVIKELTKTGDEKINAAVRRLMRVWNERKLFGNSGITRLVQQTGFSLEDGEDKHHTTGGQETPSSPTAQLKTAPSLLGVEPEELRQLAGLAAEVKRCSTEAKAVEGRCGEALSTSVIVSGRADKKVLQHYQKLMWDSVQAERKMVDLVDAWRAKIEASASQKEDRIKQIKKDLLSAKQRRESGDQAGTPAITSTAAQELAQQFGRMTDEERQKIGAKLLSAVPKQDLSLLSDPDENSNKRQKFM